jgi:hypothetical protein
MIPWSSRFDVKTNRCPKKLFLERTRSQKFQSNIFSDCFHGSQNVLRNVVQSDCCQGHLKSFQEKCFSFSYHGYVELDFISLLNLKFCRQDRGFAWEKIQPCCNYGWY